MLSTSDRLLRLLALLQSRPRWSGPELAARLGVTTRTIRNDVERVRRLGYSVHAEPGPTGGYHLGAGSELPPLLLDDGEAVAVTLGLRLVAAAAVSGLDDASPRALAKLEQVLPSRLRERAAAIETATLALGGGGPALAAEVLTLVAGACRDHRRLRFDYRVHEGEATTRTVEPHRLVLARGRWYLVAWDVDRAGWRTFRADRIELPANALGDRFTPRDPPGGGLAAYVQQGLAQATWRVRTRVVVHAPADWVAARLPAGTGLVEALDDQRCAFEAGAETPEVLAGYLALLGTDFELDGSPEVVRAVREVGARLTRAANT
jgi:predicted DNA-binding transcriptional regulator YafY